MAERAPSAATRSLPVSASPLPKRTSTPSGLASKPDTVSARNVTPEACACATSAATSAGFSIIWANGSPGAISPSKLRNFGRIASCSLELVTTMSRIGCAPASTLSQTPMVSNNRRAAAAIADARVSPALSVWPRPSAGSATTTLNGSPRPWRSAIASARPAKPPPATITSARSFGRRAATMTPYTVLSDFTGEDCRRATGNIAVKGWIAGIVTFVLAALAGLAFAFPQGAAAVCPSCFGFEPIGHAIYVEPGMPTGAHDRAIQVIAQARERVRRFYGALRRDTPVLICATEACYQRLNGGGSRGMAIYDLALMLAPNGLSETIAAHELAHIEFHARIGAWKVFREAVPTWFDEGLAVVVSDDPRYLGPPGLTDRCRGGIGELPVTLREWLRDPDKETLYRAAGQKVQCWLAAKGGPTAVLLLADQIANGTSFEDAYR